MGNVTGFKKVLSIALAATCMFVFSFSAVFASVESPQKGEVYPGSSDGEYQITDVQKQTSSLHGTLKNVKSKGIPQVANYGGKSYTVTAIGKKAFSKCKKLRVLNIKSTKLTKVDKSAFKGCKKSKIKVYVTKKMSKKNYKKLKKALKKAGIKSKNIKRKNFDK